MSELTPCNYCSLKAIRAMNKGRLHKIRRGEWIEVFIVPEGEKLDARFDEKTGNALSKQWHGAMLEITDHCVC